MIGPLYPIGVMPSDSHQSTDYIFIRSGCPPLSLPIACRALSR
nr:MAG TPA: hypothetical protein [Bacteriophage sp.]